METSSDEGEMDDHTGDLSHLGAAAPLRFQTAQQDTAGTSTSTTFSHCSNITHMDSVTAGNVNVNNPRKVVMEYHGQSQSGGEKTKEQARIEKLRKRTLSRIEDWTEGMAKTSALGKVMEKLDNGIDWITIRGSPGEGKTTVGLMALGELHKQGRDVFQLTLPKEFSQVILSCPLSVIMLDDVFGDLEFDIVKWNTWKDALHHVLSLKEHRSHEKQRKKSVTVILIGRENVLKPAFSDMGRMADYFTQDEYVVNMSHTTERDIQEKYAIWKSVSDSSGIKLEESTVDIICHIEVPHGFPHVCRLFATFGMSSGITAEDFFKTPLKFLNQTILRFMKDKQKRILFQELIKCDEKVSVRELGKLDSGFETIQAAEDLTGTYLKKEDDFFLFDHPSIYDSVAYNICKIYPLFVIDNCNLSFIHERVRIEPSRDTQHGTPSRKSGLVVYIPRSYGQDLAKRFTAEINKQNLLQVLSHTEFRHELFIEEVMSELLPLSKLITLTDSKTNEKFLSLLASNKSPQLLKYVHTHIDRQLTEDEIYTVLYGVCKYAASDVLNYMTQIYDTLDINVRYGNKTQSPLMIAAENRDSQFVQDILALNPDVNACDRYRITAFHYLSKNGLLSAVTQVIDRVTDIDMKDASGTSPLFTACINKQIDMVKLLLDRGARIDQEVVSAACMFSNEEMVNLLFERGATVNMASHRDTPLHSACQTGNMQIIRYLIDKGASVNVKCGWSVCRSPLHEVCISNTSQAVQYLLDHGADMDSRDNWGNTPLHTAAERRSHQCVDVLLKADADVHVQNKQGQIPLHMATNCYTGIYMVVGLPDIYVCQILISHGSDINKHDKEGNTPLHLLCRADSHTKTNKDGSPQPASFYEDEYRKLLILFIDNGSDVNIHNNRGEPALHGWCETLVRKKQSETK